MQKKEVTISAVGANIYGILFGLLPVGLLLLGFDAVWSGRPVQPPPDGFGVVHLILLLVGGIVVHELLHGLGWMLFAGVPREEIHIGVKWKLLTPYAHSSARMPIGPYRWAILLPGLVLGILPALISLFTASILWFGFGLFFTATAGGDFLILWLLRSVPADAEVEDHATLVGATVYY